MRRELGIACVDLDSVLFHHEPADGISRLGRPLPLGRELVRLLKSLGWQVWVLTARPGSQHVEILGNLQLSGFDVDCVTNVKPAADAYFDDKAYRIPKNWE
jgi:phosphoserine phosphatase